MKLKGKTIECTIEKMVYGGCGLARYQNKVVFVFNALPGETVQVQIHKDKKDYSEGIAIDISSPAEVRQEPREAHFLSCSPWQIMDYATENYWKEQITEDVFRSLAGYDFEGLNIIATESRLAYRNKMEFSFWVDQGTTSLAFFRRGQKRKEALDTCVLAHPMINQTALTVVEDLNRIQPSPHSLKTIILRTNRAGEVIAALYVRHEDFPALSEFEVGENWKGFTVYYSNPKSPASVPTRVLQKQGDEFLTETINGKKMNYGLHSFFQINVDLFEQVIHKITPFVEGDHILDFYCGVGAIGIALSDHVQSCTMVDNSEESIEFAQKNIVLNELEHYQAYCNKAESLLEYIEAEKILIIDPPRAGVHPKVIRAIREKKPKRIVYLSCNISTCARDLKLLKEQYEVIHKEVYNFFPATPHIEFLTILDLKETPSSSSEE